MQTAPTYPAQALAGMRESWRSEREQLESRLADVERQRHALAMDLEAATGITSKPPSFNGANGNY